MKSILIVDGAVKATLSIFQATDDECATLFSNNEEMDVIEDGMSRVGKGIAEEILA